MNSCQVCQTRVEKAPADWRAESFLRQDAHGKKFAFTLNLCPRCTRFVSDTFGDVRGYLAKQLPADTIAITQRPARKPRARATR